MDRMGGSRKEEIQEGNGSVSRDRQVHDEQSPNILIGSAEINKLACKPMYLNWPRKVAAFVLEEKITNEITKTNIQMKRPDDEGRGGLSVFLKHSSPDFLCSSKLGRGGKEGKELRRLRRQEARFVFQGNGADG